MPEQQDWARLKGGRIWHWSPSPDSGRFACGYWINVIGGAGTVTEAHEGAYCVACDAAYKRQEGQG